MADHSKPTTASTYANYTSELDGRLDDLAVGLDPAVTTATAVPTNSIRWTSATARWQKYNGTSWADLSTAYQIAITGNAGTATTLQTARTINTVSFNGSANVVVEPYVEQDLATAATRYLTFVDSSTAGHQRLNLDTDLSYNPNTNTLTVANLAGNAATATSATTAGSATTATTATNATNVAVTDDTTTNATYYPALVTANSGNLPHKVSSTKLTFNPSTGQLAAVTFAGAGTGLTGTAASLTAGSATNLGGVAASGYARSGANTDITSITGSAGSLSGGSAGTLPYQSSSGVTAQLAAGTLGQILTSGGAAPPVWKTTQQKVLIQSITASGGALAFTSIPAYAEYILECTNGAQPSSGSGYIGLQMSVNNGSSYNGNSSFATITGSGGSSSYNILILGSTGGVGFPCVFSVRLFNLNQNTANKYALGSEFHYASNADTVGAQVIDATLRASAINALSIAVYSSANPAVFASYVASGAVFNLYGVA